MSEEGQNRLLAPSRSKAHWTFQRSHQHEHLFAGPELRHTLSFREYKMQTLARSPRISHVAWGRLEVEGYPPFKDAKVFPGGASTWDWHKTGTHHVPGIQPADVEELIDRGAETVVLSKGYWERLQVCPQTLDLLAEQGISVEVLQTEAAVERFNELRERVPVGGLFHSTC